MRSAALTLIRSSNCKMQEFLEEKVLERRSKVRFSLDLRVRYRNLGTELSTVETGAVTNMSRSGVLIFAENTVSMGARVELSIDWPCLLDGRVALQLVATGRVVRCHKSNFAVAVAQYRFRTTKKTNRAIDLMGGTCG